MWCDSSAGVGARVRIDGPGRIQSSLQTPGTQGDGRDNNSAPRNLPALIILKRTRGFFRDNNRGGGEISAHKCGTAHISGFVVVVCLFVYFFVWRGAKPLFRASPNGTSGTLKPESQIHL